MKRQGDPQEVEPIVGIGLPVYNGERHLSHALDSLLSQTFPDFELVISDNASTDATAHICRRYMERDARIRYFRQPTNIGVASNWNFVFRMSRGRFFKWASCNDCCSLDLLASCVKVLESEPGTAACFGRTRFIDDDGVKGDLYADDFAVTDERPSDRFRRVASNLRLNNLLGGVFRRDVLRRTALIRRYPHSDLVFSAEVAIHGKLRLLPEILLLRRTGRENFTSQRSAMELCQLYRPELSRQLRFIDTRRRLDYLLTAARTRVPIAERVRMLDFALRLCYWGRGVIIDELRLLIAELGLSR